MHLAQADENYAKTEGLYFSTAGSLQFYTNDHAKDCNLSRRCYSWNILHIEYYHPVELQLDRRSLVIPFLLLHLFPIQNY